MRGQSPHSLRDTAIRKRVWRMRGLSPHFFSPGKREMTRLAPFFYFVAKPAAGSSFFPSALTAETQIAAF